MHSHSLLSPDPGTHPLPPTLRHLLNPDFKPHMVKLLPAEIKGSRRIWKETETQLSWHIKVRGLTSPNFKEKDL